MSPTKDGNTTKKAGIPADGDSIEVSYSVVMVSVIHVTLGSAAAQEFSHKLIQYLIIWTVGN